ncbi:hypothetical protein [Clostridium sp.]|uniref:hypothetical protein n=1 Tax=Clostridium sp. TaxID=1506 RepID=UPI00321738BC
MLNYRIKGGGINEKDINFSDINYEDIIDKEHLPINFDAKKGNPTRKAFDDREL